MKIHPLQRALALVLAAVINLAMLGGIEFLAGQEEASPQWAAVTAPRA